MTHTGDLGRRIAHHRKRLGLTREQVAERAAVSPGYVEYLEEHRRPDTDAVPGWPARWRPPSTSCWAAPYDRPPGPVPAVAAPVLEELDEKECLRLIAPGGIGRVAFNGSHGPTVLPVNYQVHEGAILFRTAAGGPMDQDLRTGMQGVEIKIGFEVDQIDEAHREGWSVLVQGPAHHVPEEETAELIGADVSPWAGGDRRLYVRIIPSQITGRRIHGL